MKIGKEKRGWKESEKTKKTKKEKEEEKGGAIDFKHLLGAEWRQPTNGGKSEGGPEVTEEVHVA